jgi:quercetin dioxygenase-like cupin family protein
MEWDSDQRPVGEADDAPALIAWTMMMNAQNKFGSAKWAAAAALVVNVVAAGTVSRAADENSGAQVKPVLAEKLPNAPGKTLTAVLVSYAPGAKSARHHHAGSVFVYVLSGAVRSENSATGPAKVYKAGESFFEPPGSEHLVSENASNTEAASLLAVFVADDGAQLTTFDK